MRIMLLLLLISTGVFSQTPASKETVRIEKLSWLEGTWNRTNVKPGRSGHERWERKSDMMQGWGVSMNGVDTSFVEKIKILSKDGELYYLADVPENQQPVHFKLTTITDTSFVCENQDHDFPKVISYQREGTNLKAIISGNGKAIDFYFEKINP